MKNNSKRDIAGIVFIALITYLIVIYIEEGLVLYETVSPPAGVNLEEWLSSFRLWALVGITLSLFAGLLWYAMGQWVVKVDRWKEANKRPTWFLYSIIPLVGVVLGIVLTERAQTGAWPAYIFFVCNCGFCFYIATAMFSPSSLKYVPPFAKKIRRW